MALSLSVANPAQAEDTSKKQETVQETQTTRNQTAVKFRELLNFVSKSGVNLETATFKEAWSSIAKWVDANQVNMGLVGIQNAKDSPSQDLLKLLIKAKVSPNDLIKSKMGVIHLYIDQIQNSSCTGTNGSDGGPGSCWVN